MSKVRDTQHFGSTPDDLTVNPIQAERLAALTRANAKELTGTKFRDLGERLKWHLDPGLFFFRRICGRVIKKDPITGRDYGVPNATVYVEDTDCGLIAYFPNASKYAWYYPIFCRRETLATVKTDECGNFCVWIPRWDIDWILTWQKRHFCFPYKRPRLIDLLKDIPRLADHRGPIGPGPGPDPAPDFDPIGAIEAVKGLTSTQLTNIFGQQLGERIRNLSLNLTIGSSVSALVDALSESAFLAGLQPPLPEEFQQVSTSSKTDGHKGDTMGMVHGTLAQHLNIDLARLKDFDLRRSIGPFLRCITYYVPEWMPIFDVPDITFRVTQDVDGDGVEDTIYSEGLFDVRWDAGYIPPITLVASPFARESRVCEYPPVVCGSVPDIQFAGMMPLSASYLDNLTGYALRPNRPRPSPPPVTPPDSTAPFCDNLNLFGCLVKTGGATKYRLVYKYSSDGGLTFSTEVPFTNVEWWWHPPGPPVHAVPDADGWYDMPPAGISGPEVNFLFPLNTPAYADGLYELRVQVGTGGTSVTASSGSKRLRVDNSYPVYTPSILWRIQGSSSWNPLTYPCPVVSRGTTPNPVEFDVRWQVLAAHYRNASIGAGDCGSGSFDPPVIQADSTASDPGGTTDWYSGPFDNTVTFHARYTLSAYALQGTYSFGLVANTRALNPAGDDANYQTLDWAYDSAVGGRYVSPSFYFSVVNA
jgi:hypothetical protein